MFSIVIPTVVVTQSINVRRLLIITQYPGLDLLPCMHAEAGYSNNTHFFSKNLYLLQAKQANEIETETDSVLSKTPGMLKALRFSKPFSMVEERRLRRGVKMFGHNWKVILRSSKFAKGRNAVELREKWRTMNKTV